MGSENGSWEHTDQNNAIPEGLRDGLDFFWQRWGDKTSNISLQLPDFQNPQWQDQYLPQEHPYTSNTRLSRDVVQGPRIKIPYFEVNSDLQTNMSALNDLIYSASIGNYGIILDVGCGQSLTPVTVAAEHAGSIVIALDPNDRPDLTYPAVHRQSGTYPKEYPYRAKLLSEKKISNSSAFYFPLNIHDIDVRTALQDSAWRVQMVAPDPEDKHGDSLLDLVFSSNSLVAPGGELILTGDGLRSGARHLQSRLDPNSYTPYAPEGLALRIRLQELHDSYTSFNTHEYSGYDLYTIYGIGDSGWFHTSQLAYEGRRSYRNQYRTVPGVAIFSGKI